MRVATFHVADMMLKPQFLPSKVDCIFAEIGHICGQKMKDVEMEEASKGH